LTIIVSTTKVVISVRKRYFYEFSSSAYGTFRLDGSLFDYVRL